MEVILKKNFNRLGYKNDIVKVRKGYGLNFLIPRKIADFATDSAKKNAQENVKQSLKKIERLRNEALELSKKLTETPICFEINDEKNVKLSQIVSVTLIINKLKQQFDFDFHKNSIILNKKIGMIGEHSVDVKIFRDIVAKVKIKIELKKIESEK